MTTCVALLRAINLGGHNKVAMADLRSLLSDLGYGSPQTYIQSGQALFDTDEDEAMCAGRIAGAIKASLGLTIPVLVRTVPQLAAVLAANPYPDAEPAKVLVVFYTEPLAPDVVGAVDRERFAPDVFEVRDRELYCYFPNGQGRSKFGTHKLLANGTGRNLNTIRSVIELATAR